MRVLITGCTGYVGRQIASRLARAGWDKIGSGRRPLSRGRVAVVIGNLQTKKLTVC